MKVRVGQTFFWRFFHFFRMFQGCARMVQNITPFPMTPLDEIFNPQIIKIIPPLFGIVPFLDGVVLKISKKIAIFAKPLSS